jgi:hypothetical protein
MHSWVEEIDSRIRIGIKRDEVWPLEGVAIRARKSKVAWVVAAAMLPGTDVLDVECEE